MTDVVVKIIDNKTNVSVNPNSIIVNVAEDKKNITVIPNNIPVKIISNDIVVKVYNGIAGQDGAIQTVTGNIVDNTDSRNPVVTQVQPDWNETSGLGEILNKPTIHTGDVVSVSGNIVDNTDPTNPVVTQKQSDWNETDSGEVDYIKNKPSIPAAQVNSDWNAVSGIQEILNKPILHLGDVETVTGLDTDNTDPTNPIVKIAVDGLSITGDGTPSNPLVATAPSGIFVETVTGLNTDNTDPQNPVVNISVDGVTITGDGTPANPLVGSPASSMVSESNVILINQTEPEIAGKQHQSYASARAWLLANSVPSGSNKWIIRFYGTLTENLTGANSALRYVTIDGGDKNSSTINGSVDFAERGEYWSATSNKIQNCAIANLAVTNTGGGEGKGCTFENVYIATSTASGAGHYISCLDCGLEGNFSSFNGTGSTNAKSVIVGGNISAWGVNTTIPAANWYMYGINFGNGGYPVLTLQGVDTWNPLNIKDCYFESWGQIMLTGEINWADCDFNSGAADIVLTSGVTFNVCNTVFRSNIILKTGSVLNSTDLVFVGSFGVILQGGTWNNKGSSYKPALSRMIATNLQTGIDELKIPLSKSFTYNGDGTLDVVTDINGTKTMSYNGDGTLAASTGTGVYFTKTMTYAGGVLTDITVS